MVGGLLQAERQACKFSIVSDDLELSSLMLDPYPQSGKVNILKSQTLGEILYESDILRIENYFYTFKKRAQENIIGIHFRGNDFYQWNKNAVIPAGFFLEQLKQEAPDLVVVCSDDMKNKIFRDILAGIEGMGIDIVLGKGFVIHDVLLLATARSIIASPSTYSLMASILGGRHIIYPNNFAKIEEAKGVKFWQLARSQENPYTRIDLR